MEIEHDIVEFIPQPRQIELFRRFVTAAAERAAVSLEAIGRVVICSEKRYGPIIESISRGTGYTNNETAVGVGKTLPRRVDGAVVSDIVLRMDLFGAFGGVPDDVLVTAGWTADVQQIFYEICHEFGHTSDDALRSDLHDASDPRIVETYDDGEQFAGRDSRQPWLSYSGLVFGLTERTTTHERLPSSTNASNGPKWASYRFHVPIEER